MNRTTAPLQTVDRALHLLNCFTVTKSNWGITELARELGIAKSMVVRLLETLEAHGYVDRNAETRRYTLGLRLVSLGLLAQNAAGNLRTVALPIMQALTAEVGETTVLCVPRGYQSICLEQVISPRQQLRMAIELGTTSPLTAGASNKSLLAFLPEDQIEEVIARGVAADPPEHVTDPAALREQLRQIRAQGWSATHDEMAPDVAGVAAPIFDPMGRVAASLSIGGPTSRFTPDRIPDLVAKATSAASMITRKLAGG